MSPKSADDESSTSSCQHNHIFQEYFESKAYSDLTLVCRDGIEIPAHRFALAAFSPVFKKMFDVESNLIIKVNDIDGCIMTEILRYIYTEEVNDIGINAAKLLYGSEKYELNGLKDLCEAEMIKNTSVDNAVDYLVLADQYNLKDLLHHCIEFVKS